MPTNHYYQIKMFQMTSEAALEESVYAFLKQIQDNGYTYVDTRTNPVDDRHHHLNVIYKT